MKEKRKVPVRDTIKLLWAMDRKFPVIVILQGGLNALLFYLPVLLVARILDLLVYREKSAEPVSIAVVGLVGIWLLKGVKALLEKEMKTRSYQIAMRFETLVPVNTLNISFSDLESDYAKEMRARILADRSWGSGFFGVADKFCNLCNSGFELLGSVIMLIPLAMQVSGSAAGKVAAALLFNIGLAVVGASVYAKWYQKKESAAMNQMTQAEKNSRFWYMDEGGSGAIGAQSLKDIFMYRAKKMIQKTIDTEREGVRKNVFTIARINSAGGLGTGMIQGILLCVSYYCVLALAIAGTITVGMVLRYAQAIFQACMSVSASIRLAGEFRTDVGRIASTLEYLNLEAEKTKGDSFTEMTKGVIEFRNVSFRYPGTKELVLDHVSLKIEPSEKIAVVGKNGSGKTTLVKLLCRLYEPEEGEILWNGKNIREYDLREWQKIFAIVFQDYSLLSLTLGQNVAASEQYEAERAKEVLQLAGFGERLNKLKKGLETVVYPEYEQDGVSFSGGEEQKIAIARAIYKGGQICILDEPTAALDPVSESRVYESFDEIVKGKTAVYISHRLSSCKFSDRIFVLDNGKIAESGTHEALLSKNGLYAQLWQAQAQYYKV
ncbi:ABC transporter ATP-binding protein [Gallintestinimicrobium propionicum]|uniref:ABC transporter ATP-binding protein/permease n=1 Tax=Gallintestinimicrobium propionicum TaxID=2981770 RepID=A0AAE3AZP8_9FIRM|nr:ABC transporter ATP-binding protein [Gallintestinimicrobium propionicum]MCC2168939.1 ABC transporter ATP-binding protein/permease [Gallintestinimicrobium propionicum]